MTIKSDEEMKSFMDSVAAVFDVNVDSMSMSTNTWGEQLRDALIPCSEVEGEEPETMDCTS